MDPGPLSNEPEMESYAHMMQLVMLLTGLLFAWRDRDDFFAAGNLSIFYPAVSPRSGRKVRRKLAFRGPDFFVVLGARKKPLRNSWVVENEDGKYPDVIVEVLSDSTRAADRGKKKEIYEKIFRTPEYFLFDPKRSTLDGYRLSRGRYVRIAQDASGHLPSKRLGFSLGLCDTPSIGCKMVRLFTPEGEMVALPQEAAEQEGARADRERARADRLAAKLRALGVEPDPPG
jgi:Uma2 family endonuclease